MRSAEAAPVSETSGALLARAQPPYRVMVVDDSAVIRGLLIRSLEADPELVVLASASNGQMALAALERHDIEVVILDIEMPVMDGLTALPKLLAAKPGVKVIIASTLTRRGADVSMKALAAGAADYVTKPGASALTSADEFKRELVAKVKALGHARRAAPGLREVHRSDAAPLRGAAPRAEPAVPLRPPSRATTLRPLGREHPDAIAIGSSTGGPQALFRVLGALRNSVQQPIFITQHMPATFTTILAEHIARTSNYPAAEGVDGQAVRGGQIYVAPGDFHMTVEGTGRGEKVVRLSKTPPENYCRPAVDPMLRSLAAVYGGRVLCLILTGMGHDGLKGGEAIVAAGGTVIAQDEATSVVWGMPGAVANAGICSAVLPIDEIGPFLVKLASRR